MHVVKSTSHMQIMTYLISNSFKCSGYSLTVSWDQLTLQDRHKEASLLSGVPLGSHIQWENLARDEWVGRDRDQGIYILGSLPAGSRFGSMYIILLGGSLRYSFSTSQVTRTSPYTWDLGMAPRPAISKPRGIYCTLFIFYNPSDTFVKVLTLNSIAFEYMIMFLAGILIQLL